MVIDAEVQALSRKGVAAWYGICPEMAGRLINDQVLPVIQVGSTKLVPIRALEAYEDELGRQAARRVATALSTPARNCSGNE